MRIGTAIAKAYSKAANRIIKALDDRVWKERVAAAKVNVDELAHVLIDNTVKQQRQSVVANGQSSFGQRDAQRKKADMEFGLVMAVIKQLNQLKLIVGVQPISGPVGLTYRIACSTPEDGRLELKVLSTPTEARTRKLQARWNIEAVQDALAMHEVELEREITQAIGSIVVQELVLDVLSALVALTKPKKLRLGKTGSAADKLAVQINVCLNDIGAATKRGAGNYVVLSSKTFERLAPSKLLKLAGDSSNDINALKLVGTLNGGMTNVYEATGFEDDVLLMGYKGPTETDAGYIYAPYLPLMMSGPVIDPSIFQPTMTLMTRYGANVTESTDELVGTASYYQTLKLV